MVLDLESQPCPHLELPQGLELGKYWDLEVLLGQHLPLEGTVSPRCLSSALSFPRTSFSLLQSQGLRHCTRARLGLLSPNMQVSTRVSQEDPSTQELTQLQVYCLVPQQSGAGP